MKRIYPVLLCLSLAFSVIAQDATLYKLQNSVAPVIDGIYDELWNDVEEHSIDKYGLWNLDYPSVDLATWQAVWNNTAIFVIVVVEEDFHCDQWCSGDYEWVSDRVELYFDVNVNNLDDGEGPVNWPNGHYQFAPAWIEYENSYSTCESSLQGWPYCYGYTITGADYIYEYSIPFSSLTDEFDVALDPETYPTIGFDVYITDCDGYESGYNNLVWMNNASGPSMDHSWNNMNDCGEVKLQEGEEEEEEPEDVKEATVYKLPYGIAPEIDGYVDELWDDVEAHDIDKQVMWKPEIPTIDVATWQAVWNDTAIFILISVEEDEHCDIWCSGAEEWESDRAELFFDVNVGNLTDGNGPVSAPNGHYQFAPAWIEYENSYSTCESSYQGWPYCYGYTITGEDYIYEYSIPFSTLMDEYNVVLDPNTYPTIGFDVQIADRDYVDYDFKLLSWMNDASSGSDIAFFNMDGCGRMIFEDEEEECNNDLAGTEPFVYFYYIDENLYDVEITLNDLGTCEELTIYQPSVTVDENVIISYTDPNYGYLFGTVSEDGNSITGSYDIGNNDCEGSQNGTWSVTRVHPEPAIPTLLYPNNNSFGISTTVGLTWSYISDVSYDIQVSKYQNFSPVLLYETGISLSSYILSGLDENTFYYWRVRSTGDCMKSEWSPGWSFYTGAMPLHIDNTGINSGYFVYPSPADNYINIECPGSVNSVVSIYSFDGKLLIREYMHDGIVTIDIHHLAKGFYLLKVNNENINHTGKIIIDR
jgi:hypothetical protein